MLSTKNKWEQRIFTWNFNLACYNRFRSIAKKKKILFSPFLMNIKKNKIGSEKGGAGVRVKRLNSLSSRSIAIPDYHN